MIAAFFVISLLFKRRNMSSDLFLTYFCVTLPVALITTRLFYCITDGLPLKDWFSMDSIREGGLSIIGGILGGTISVLAVSYFKKVNFFRAADCIVVGLLLAQAIGRWAISPIRKFTARKSPTRLCNSSRLPSTSIRRTAEAAYRLLSLLLKKSSAATAIFPAGRGTTLSFSMKVLSISSSRFSCSFTLGKILKTQRSERRFLFHQLRTRPLDYGAPARSVVYFGR